MSLLLWITVLLQGSPTQPGEIDPAIRHVIEQFFATQEAENTDAYLDLWSTKAQRPQAYQLKFIFDSGDDKFSELRILHVAVRADVARVRVSVMRARTDLRTTDAAGNPRTFTTPLQLSLALVREADGWKLLREGAPADELAGALIETDDPAARRALMQAEPDVVNTRLVEAFGRRADALAQKRLYAEAQRIYERSLEVAQVIGDKKAEGQAFQNIANTLYYQRDFAAARAMYERRLALDRENGHDEGIASALTGLATIHYSISEYGAALRAYREALAIQERLGDQSLISSTLISTGNVLYLQGDYDAAIADYRRAEELKRKYFDPSGAAMALEGLGRVYSAQGDYAAALTAFGDALEVRRKLRDEPRQAFALQSMGEIHTRLANTDSARRLLDEAKLLFEKGQDPSNVGRVWQAIAVNELLAARFAVGEKAYAQSIAACTAANDAACVARAQVGLGFALAAQQKYDEAIGWYRKSVVSFTALPAPEAAARAQVGLAEALSGKGEYEAALKEAASARHTAVSFDNDDLLWRALVSQARAERKLGHKEVALGVARAAVVAVRRMSAAALERPGHAVPRDTTAAFATAAILHAEIGDAAAAFAAAEEMRAHALRGWLAPHEREIAKGMTAAEIEEERSLAAELTPLFVQRDREKELQTPDPARLKRLSGAIAEGVRRRTSAQQALYAKHPELQTWRGLAPAATALDLDPLLDDPTTLLLAFVLDEHDVLVITASRPADAEHAQITTTVVGIETHTLGETIARALDSRVLESVDGWRNASSDLFTIVPQPVRTQIAAARKLVVVPDGLLWRVPFEAMPLETRYVADRAEVSYLPSVTAAVHLSRVARATLAAPAPLAVGSPNIAAAVVEGLKATAPTWMLRPPASARDEARQIVEIFKDAKTDVLEGDAATVAGLRAAVTAATVIHIAAPFRVNAASPLFSRVLLSAEQNAAGTATDDGLLETREAFTLPLSASLVVFSDPAALSMRDAAPGVVAVHWAWSAGGTPTLVMRRWGGSEAAATSFVGRFYTAVRTGRSPGRALQEAAAEVRTTAEGRAPAAWAGWVVVSMR